MELKNMVSSQNVDWDKIESMVKTLSKTISKLPRTFTSISTVSRGGLIPSRLLAEHLGIEKILVDKKRYLQILYLLMIFLIQVKHLTKSFP